MPRELNAKIKEIIASAYNARSVRFDIKDADFKAGQFLSVSLKDDPKIKRYLSISNSPTETGYLEFTKKLTGSDFCKALETLKTGDQLHLQFPMGKFTLEDNPAEKIAFLSGGIGITPIRSMCKYIVDKKLGTDILLLYANRTIRDIVFKDDFEKMQREYSKLKVHHVLSEAAAGFESSVGRINAEIVKDKIPDYSERKFFLCGPPGMVEAMKKVLSEELNLAADKIVTENFVGY